MTEFRIADTFTESLTRLTNQEQKAVKTTAFDLQLDPASPGMKFHKLERAKDRNFWSIRVSSDIRLIVHKTATSLLLCYVDHHDKAYAWAERRKIEQHPKTGAAQLVVIPQTVGEIQFELGGSFATSAPIKPPLFGKASDDDLLGYGVPPEWLDDVRSANEDTLLDLGDCLPQEAMEALLNLATGVTPQAPVIAPAGADSFAHPDAQRRFRTLANREELERALEYPWEKWTVFLHPAQRGLVERGYSGPARISGSAGTGKSVVALHRAVHLARVHPKARIVLTTFSPMLSDLLTLKLRRLVGNEPAVFERIRILSITELGAELYENTFGKPRIASREVIEGFLSQAANTLLKPKQFSDAFLFGEWTDIVDAWQLRTWEQYQNVARLGRKTRLGAKQRELLWSIFEQVRRELDARELITWSDIFGRVAEQLSTGGERPFDFAVVDEAQDIRVAEIRFLAALASARPDALFFTGDLGQRIYQQPFSWKSLGVDLRGRSHTLRINYRTSHQIRSHADKLLPPQLSDVDGISERRNAVSVFNGPPPSIEIVDDVNQEATTVGKWLSQRLHEGIRPEEIGVFVRSDAELERARAAVKRADATAGRQGGEDDAVVNAVNVSTMHLAKGLEFRAVAVMACDEDVLPLQDRIESIGDDADLEEVYSTERHLLYVACTRARDHLLVTGVNPASEFLDDLTKE